MKKFYLFLMLALAVSFPLIYFIDGNQENQNIPIKVYKSPTCGCCVGYSGELSRNGFDVDVIERTDMQYIKEKYNVPPHMESCHTSVVGDYFVEGHVPLEVVEKLLIEQPDVEGIAMPGMPSGSPGMPGPKRNDFVIYSLKNGNWEEYERI